jgi:hypothetical protein
MVNRCKQLHLIAALLTTAVTSGAFAQCSGYVLEPGPGQIVPANGVTALTIWDPDGAGPAAPAPVVGFNTSVQRWNGAAWQPMTSIPSGVAGLTVFGGELLAGTAVFETEDDYWSVARWTGSSWARLGIGPTRMDWTRDFVVHEGQLWVSSTNATFSRFDGSTWESVGPGYSEIATAVGSYGGRLIGGGWMALATEPSPRYGVISWGGSPASWEPVGSGAPAEVYSFATYQGKLVAAGTGGVHSWDGATWQLLGDRMAASVATTFNGQLIIGGSFPGGAKRWNGASWESLGVELAKANGYNPAVFRMAQWNGELLMVGSFDLVGNQSASNIARYRCIPCYANCDNSQTAPALNANDFNCFLNKFAAGCT